MDVRARAFLALLLSIVSCLAAPIDTNPPVVVMLPVRQATIEDTPIRTPSVRYCIYDGGLLYPDTTGETTNTTHRIVQMHYTVVSNHCYILWYSSSIKGPWKEYAALTVCSMTNTYTNMLTVPLLETTNRSMRFYQLRNN